jgi:hypothetical protein
MKHPFYKQYSFLRKLLITDSPHSLLLFFLHPDILTAFERFKV